MNRMLAALTSTLVAISVNAAEVTTVTSKADPHYSEAGFFDLHVCNWPERPPFLMAVFSTFKFNEVERLEIYRPDGILLGEIQLAQYRLIQLDGKPEKHAYISHLEIAGNVPEGWYTAIISMRDGSQVWAMDYVIFEMMQRAQNPLPPDQGEHVPVPGTLRWDPVPGAAFYQVTVRDMWNDGKTIFQSSLVKPPFVELPQGMLQPEGWYTWRIHARDVDGNIVLGDFNHGSLTRELSFTTAEN